MVLCHPWRFALASNFCVIVSTYLCVPQQQQQQSQPVSERASERKKKKKKVAINHFNHSRKRHTPNTRCWVYEMGLKFKWILFEAQIYTFTSCHFYAEAVVAIRRSVSICEFVSRMWRESTRQYDDAHICLVMVPLSSAKEILRVLFSRRRLSIFVSYLFIYFFRIFFYLFITFCVWVWLCVCRVALCVPISYAKRVCGHNMC